MNLINIAALSYGELLLLELVVSIGVIVVFLIGIHLVDKRK